MRILSIAAGDDQGLGHEIVSSNFRLSNPFGYDLIVVNSSDVHSMYGTSNQGEVDGRWSNAIQKWANEKRKILVLMHGLNVHSLNWLPLEQSTRMTLAHLESAGNSDYLGNIVTTEPLLRRFLTDNRQQFLINTYLRLDSPNENIIINSGVDSTLVTSFTYKKENLEIIFIPHTALANLSTLFSAYDTPANAWGIESADDLMGQLSHIDSQINELNTQRDDVKLSLDSLNATISQVIQSDMYLVRAIGHYDATKSTEHPSPESYYGAIEAIENAFNSEREMRDALGLTKAYVDKVMRRANDFRHEARDGQPPTPLNPEEILDLGKRVNKVISSYIQYLMN